ALSIVLTGAGLLEMRSGFPPPWEILPGLLIGSAFVFLALFVPFYMFLFLPLAAYSSAQERGVLCRSAAEALSRLEDKASLPSVIEVAFGSQSWAAQWAAQQALV